MNQRPMPRDIPYHQIMGDRGRGNSPNSSDGVVAYWSSHLDGAQSTRIVPSSHNTHQNAEGIEEVRRILKANWTEDVNIRGGYQHAFNVI